MYEVNLGLSKSFKIQDVVTNNNTNGIRESIQISAMCI